MCVGDFLSYCLNDDLVVEIWNLEREVFECIYSGEIQNIDTKIDSYIVECFEFISKNENHFLILNVKKHYINI